jgi:hypothetical protein
MRMSEGTKTSELATSGSVNARTIYSGADKSLARPGRKQATATEDSDVHISYL